MNLVITDDDGNIIHEESNKDSFWVLASTEESDECQLFGNFSRDKGYDWAGLLLYNLYDILVEYTDLYNKHFNKNTQVESLEQFINHAKKYVIERLNLESELQNNNDVLSDMLRLSVDEQNICLIPKRPIKDKDGNTYNLLGFDKDYYINLFKRGEDNSEKV